MSGQPHACDAAPVMPALARRVDHVFVPTDEPLQVYELFVAELGLPATMPPVRAGNYWTSMVTLGSIGLEIIGPAVPIPGLDPSDAWDRWWLDRSDRGFDSLSVEGLALDCALDESTATAAVDQRALHRSDLVRMTVPGAPETFANVVLYDALDRLAAFLVLYPPDSVYQHRFDLWSGALRAERGGGLGLVEATAIVIRTPTPERHLRQIAALAADEEMGENSWRPPAGPSIRINPSTLDVTVGLELAVRDVTAARALLSKVDLRGLHIAVVAAGDR